MIERWGDRAIGRHKNSDHPLTSSPIHKAAIIGAGLTGLMTARVLANHFDHVVLLDRDTLPKSPVPRKGVPHSHQYHGLMARGYYIMRELYPELEAALVADGIPLPDTLRDFIVYAPNGAGYLPRWAADIRIPTCSRHRLEWHMRRLTLALPNVTAVSRTHVNSLISSEDKTAVLGLHFTHRPANAPPQSERLFADLIVDCSGRHSKIDRWLQELGHTPPPRTERKTAVHYATRLYHIPTGFEPTWNGLLVTMQYPQNPRFGGLRQIEDKLWQVALAGMNGLMPPTDDAGFLAFARSLASPIIYEAIEQAVPAGTAVAYGNKLVRRRHFEKAPQLPINLLVLGDANCCYNPLYGQGMTSAALSVAVLRDALWEAAQRHGNTVNRRPFSSPRSSPFPPLASSLIHKQIARATNQLWQQATQLDQLWATPNVAEWTFKQRLLNRLSRESLPLLAEDQALFIRGTEIRHLLRPVWHGINGRFLYRLLTRLAHLSPPATINHTHPKIVIEKETLFP